jgi:hypothetical protein
VTSQGSAPVPGGRVNVAPSANRTDDVAAWVSQAGARTGSFANPPAHVVLTPGGNGAVYDLAANDGGPYVIGLVSDGHVTRLDPATVRDGIVEFTVDRPDLVTAVTLERDGREIARAPLSVP